MIITIDRRRHGAHVLVVRHETDPGAGCTHADVLRDGLLIARGSWPGLLEPWDVAGGRLLAWLASDRRDAAPRGWTTVETIGAVR